MNEKKRKQQIIRYNVLGIIMNGLLSSIKVFIGLSVASNAIVLDGINSLTDLIAAIMIIVFARLAGRKADRAHPFGYGRMEYICSMLITMLVSGVGLKAVSESFMNIIHPAGDPDYNMTVVIIMVISLIIKLVYGTIVKNKGRELNSQAMIMTGEDNLSDAYVATAVLFSIVILKFTGFNIENYLCIVIALLIVRTGIRMLLETMTKIIGSPVDPSFKKKISTLLANEEGVYNVSSLVIHNYGENNNIGSVDIDVDEKMRAGKINELTRRLKEKAAQAGLTLTSVGINGVKVNDPKVNAVFDAIIETIRHHEGIVRAQSLDVDLRKKQISFAVVMDHDARNKQEKIEKLKEDLQQQFPKMDINIYTAINAG